MTTRTKANSNMHFTLHENISHFDEPDIRIHGSSFTLEIPLDFVTRLAVYSQSSFQLIAKTTRAQLQQLINENFDAFAHEDIAIEVMSQFITEMLNRIDGEAEIPHSLNAAFFFDDTDEDCTFISKSEITL